VIVLALRIDRKGLTHYTFIKILTKANLMRKALLIIVKICLFLNVLYSSEIPFEHTNIINATVEKVFNVNQLDAIDRISGGFSSPGLYKISVAGKAYVVRFYVENCSLEDRLRELEAMEIAAEQGLAPKIIYASPLDGILIMDFIDTSKNPEKFNLLSEANLKLS
jgi:hypothetical protein